MRDSKTHCRTTIMRKKRHCYIIKLLLFVWQAALSIKRRIFRLCRFIFSLNIVNHHSIIFWVIQDVLLFLHTTGSFFMSKFMKQHGLTDITITMVFQTHLSYYSIIILLILLLNAYRLYMNNFFKHSVLSGTTRQ